MAAAMDLSDWENDPKLYLFTSLTAGSSHIITATSRLETILKANRIPFQAIDTATEEKARRLWARRAGKRKLPGLVKEGYVIGDLEEIEEWNEFGELKENIGPVPGSGTIPAPAKATTASSSTGTSIGGSSQSAQTNLPMRDSAVQAAGIGAARKSPTALVDASKIRPLPGAKPATSENKEEPSMSGLEAADQATKPETMNTASSDKAQSIRIAENNSKLAADPGASSGAHEDETSSETAKETRDPPVGDESSAVGDQGHEAALEAIGSAKASGEDEPSTTATKVEGESVSNVEAQDIGNAPTTQNQNSAEAEEASESVQD